MFQIDAACIIYVIHRTYQRWKTSGYYLLMAYKIPFYMALHPLAATDNWSEPYCSIIAGGFFFWTIFNILTVGMSALVSWLIVCKKAQLNFGTYDYKIFIIPFTCYTSDQYTTVPAILLIVDILVLTLSLCCYINILNEIKTSELCNRNGHLIKAYRKILGYIVMYIVQWTPLMIYVIADVLNQERLWLYFFTVSFISMGGILNMVQYILNEGWKDKPDLLYEISRRGISQSIKSHEIETSLEVIDE
ncbi:8972_t:CDS:2 [Diversispora eburnea]|uniref:8972_t:CDS:1 n=1 Tax=Diversispora eburnea TaxID=1213867 RepID=A0A9N8WEZ4_9GLOM|nr:8972_t:CDS:2 [Diversispora eburnea]